MSSRGDRGNRGRRGGGGRGGEAERKVFIAPGGSIPNPSNSVKNVEDQYHPPSSSSDKTVKGKNQPPSSSSVKKVKGKNHRPSSSPAKKVEEKDHPPSSSPVKKVEDKDHPPRSSDGYKFPYRPGYGNLGQPVTLWANYFEMIPSPDLVLHRYHIGVDPEAKGKKLGRIIKMLLDREEYSEFRNDIVTDFKSTLISRRRLSPDIPKQSFPYIVEGEDDPRGNAQTYALTVEPTGTLTVSALTDYLTSTNMNATYDKLPMLQALNIFLGHYAKSSPGVATVGSSKSFSFAKSSPPRDLGAGLTALRGFFSSVRVATCRILVNVNVSHGAFYEAIRLDQLIRKYKSQPQSTAAKLHSFLKGVRVQVMHLEDMKNKDSKSTARVRTICGLATLSDGKDREHPPRVGKFGAQPMEVEFFRVNPRETPSSSAAGPAAGTPGSKQKGKGKRVGESSQGPDQNVSQEGGYISVYQHFKDVYPKWMKTMAADLPVVNVGIMENPTYFPANVCMVMPGQVSRSKLDPSQTQQMIRFAVRMPWENADSITQEGVRTVGLLPQENEKLRRFGVSVTNSLITVPARVLTAPKVLYHGNKPAQVENGGWSTTENKFNTRVRLQNWTYLVISYHTPSQEEFEQRKAPVPDLIKILQASGIEVTRAVTGRWIAISSPDDKAIEETFKGFANNAIDPSQTGLILVILPKVDTVLYNRIKHIGDVKVGIHTVCVVSVMFEKNQAKYYANVALKFNLKLGGINHVVESTRLGIINEDKTMVVGIDVTHPSPGSAASAPSVAAMVASVDKRLGQWPADLRIQESRKEMVSELDSMLKSRLRLWRSRGKHAAYPENLLVYRDGVSEGQYATVVDTELPLLRKACADLYSASDTKNGLPHITIVIVGKRHHTRFYPTDKAHADRNSNPKSGTVVDRGVTESRNWDFFLQSHEAIKGTARPAHYYIVLDEIFTKQRVSPPHKNVADVLEDLTHSMCYLYGRATRAVSICPPAYYADIVCERARCYLSGLFDAPPAATSAPNESGHDEKRPAAPQPRTDDVRIHDKLKDTMFYV